MVVVAENIDTILAARTLLATTLDKSRALSSSLHETGSRLQQIHNKLPSFEAPSSENYSFMSIGGLIDHAVGPAAEVAKVHDIVCELEKLVLSDSSSDLFNYTSTVRKLEEALKFLEDICRLAIQWLEGIVELMDIKTASGDLCLSSIHKSLRILRMSQGTNDRARLPGRCLSVAFHELEARFRMLLIQNNDIAPCPLPSLIQQLQAIRERLSANGKLEKCISIFVEARGSNARKSLQALGLDYLDEVQRMESYIDKWIQHLEFAVKSLFEPELELCRLVYEKSGSDVWITCFAEIVFRSGFLSFLRFGDRVARCNSIPYRVKLVKLLDIFAVMNELRLEFNCLFVGEPCGEIRRLTRDLIRGVVNGVCEIFLELDGRVKSRTRSGFCNNLLGDDKYRPILEQVLAIHRIWKSAHVVKGSVGEVTDASCNEYEITEFRFNTQNWVVNI